jgi:hypothetical protein
MMFDEGRMSTSSRPTYTFLDRRTCNSNLKNNRLGKGEDRTIVIEDCARKEDRHHL